MDDRTALHTAARRWVQERVEYLWLNRTNDSASKRAWGLQKCVLDAIKFEVEAYIPNEFESLSHLHETLELIGYTATNWDLKRSLKAYRERLPNAEQIEETERAQFIQALREIRQTSLHDIDPLPHSRTLLKEEAISVWAALTEAWEFQHAWYPIGGPPRPGNAIAFLDDAFRANLMPGKLPRLLRQHNVERVYEIHEGRSTGLLSGDPEREIDVMLINPFYMGVEKYWFTKELDWLIYASHESSITVGGEWLITAIKQAWPDWREGLYEQFEIAHWHLGDYQPHED